MYANNYIKHKPLFLFNLCICYSFQDYDKWNNYILAIGQTTFCFIDINLYLLPLMVRYNL